MSLGRPDLQGSISHTSNVSDCMSPARCYMSGGGTQEFGVDVASGWPPLLAVSSDRQITSCPDLREMQGLLLYQQHRRAGTMLWQEAV